MLSGADKRWRNPRCAQPRRPPLPPAARESRARGAQPLRADTAHGGHSRGQTRAHSRSGGHLPAVGRDGLSGLWGSLLVVEERRASGLGAEWGSRDWESQGPGWRKDTQAPGRRALAPGPSCLPGAGRGRARPGPHGAPGLQKDARGWCSLRKMLRLRPRVLGGSGIRAAPSLRGPRSGAPQEERWEEG